jgi:integrase
MAKRQRHRLTAREVQTTTKDICDGFGLWVQYTKQYDSRSWLFRYRFDGADDQMGLGSVLVTSLAEARKRADEARNLIARGVNPRVARDQAKRDRLEAAKNRMTFRAAFEAYISKHSVGWKSAKHLAQWKASLKHTRAINDLDAGAIDTPHLLRVLEPIWREKTETASRIRARIEMVLDFAKAAKARTGDNPARWEALKDLLPAPSKLARFEKHHAALPYADAPAFMRELRAKFSVSARALEFAILTAGRVGEVLGARWSEVNLTEKIWTVPAERMKADAEHTVPLSNRALAILADLPRDGDLVFPGRRGQMHDQSLRDMVESIRAGITTHGFRSSFRDWAGDIAHAPREVAEAALAHKVGNSTETSYRRGSALERRRKLMEQWARFCEAPPVAGENVIALAGRA